MADYLDDVARFNRDAWERLAEAGIEYSRPWLDLDAESARKRLDPEGVMGDVESKDVLCLAGGGGQQSVGFALLGANVTVIDISETQLDRDREAAEHHGTEVTLVVGDMRDLSEFADDSFDLVYHAHSICFVPEVEAVFDEVARVLRACGLYRLSCPNPYVHGVWDGGWDGTGYRIRSPYVTGQEIVYEDECWDVEGPDGQTRRVPGPREYRHTLTTLVNGLLERSFGLLRIREWPTGDPEAEPESWEHFAAYAPPWWTFWSRYMPGSE